MLLFAARQGTIHYFEWTITPIDNRERAICPSPGSGVASLSVAPSTSGPRFVSGGDDKKVRLWDYGAQREERSFEGHGHRVNCVDWHPSFALVASASKDFSVRLWDPRAAGAAANLATLTGHKADVTKVQHPLTPEPRHAHRPQG